MCSEGVEVLKCKRSRSCAGCMRWHPLDPKVVIGGSLHSSLHRQSLKILLHRYTIRFSGQLHVSGKFWPRAPQFGQSNRQSFRKTARIWTLSSELERKKTVSRSTGSMVTTDKSKARTCATVHSDNRGGIQDGHRSKMVSGQ